MDAICGAGKSQSLINYINDRKNDGKKFLYITPFLSEVERIKNECSKRKFKSPEARGAKIYDIKNLLSKGENIVSSHALFKTFDEEVIDLALLNDYVLIMDEVADVVEIPDISKYDLDTLLEKYVEIGERGKLTWVAQEYKGEFEPYKKQCELGCLYIYHYSSKCNPTLIWMFPISIFNAFQEVYILTYMFDAQIQKYYYDYYGLEYKYLYIKDNYLVEEPQKYDLSKYASLVEICEHEKLNKIGELSTSLSMSWYGRNKDNVIMKILRNNCNNYFKNITKTPSKDNMWTTFKEYKSILKGKGYAKGFVSLSMRATNMYIDKSSIAYLSNRYLNPVIKNFFLHYGIEVKEDEYALSELIQFIFRSRIRKKEPINLYIPSARMRGLLKEWISTLENK
jgi:hypothetical protein